MDVIAQRVLPRSAGPTLSIAALTGLGAILSAFMNNVGAMALLMPLAFSTILGGITTLIGTPPNLIVSSFRAEAGMGSFAMFDFTPVGIAVAGAGVVFTALLGPRMVPKRQGAGAASFDTGTYMTEA